jgi:rhamnose utilization protein RhaD (predicted bifunctional aldolase and dehydrogenase)
VDVAYGLLRRQLAVEPRDFRLPAVPEAPALRQRGYSLPADEYIQRLAFDPLCREILVRHWALYPDHVVFLGAEPAFFETPERLVELIDRSGESPEYAIISGYGTFVGAGINQNKLAMLKCFGDVLARLRDADALRALSTSDVHRLLDWEAEKYRSRIAK